MSIIKKVRLGWTTETRKVSWEEIKLCEHIKLIGEIKKDTDYCEYTEELNIYCDVCKKLHKIIILIN